MSAESLQALEKIVAVYESLETLSMRQLKVFDIALEGLGLNKYQRAGRLEKWRGPHVERIAAKRARDSIKDSSGNQVEVA